MGLKHQARFYETVSVTLAYRAGIKMRLKAVKRGPRYLSFDYRLNDPNQLNGILRMADPIALAVGSPAVMTQRVDGYVNFQYQLQRDEWLYYTRSDLPLAREDEVGVGIGISNKLVTYSFDPPHSLIAGATQISGKTETTRSILCGSMTTYTPYQLGVIICDSHWDHDDFRNVAHLEYPIAHEAREIDKAIEYVDQELAKRRSGNIRGAKPWIIVIEEAETELQDKRRREIIEAVGKEAAKFKMFLIVTTQKPQVKNLGDLINNLNNRWVGKVSDADVSRRLTGVADLGCHLLTPRGDFMHISDRIERVQIAKASDTDMAMLPRREIRAPEVAISDTPQTANFERTVGRPPDPIDPKKLAWYMVNGPANVTENWARDNLDLKRHNHIKHKEFATALIQEIQTLLAARKRRLA